MVEAGRVTEIAGEIGSLPEASASLEAQVF